MFQTNDLKAKWEKDVLTFLKGKRITSVAYMTNEEVDNFGWYESTLEFTLNDGGILTASSDDEGNSAGTWFGKDTEFPVCSTNDTKGIKTFSKEAQQFVGKTIDSVRYFNDKEMEAYGWYKAPLVIAFTDGEILFSACDDEGNNGGSIFTNYKNLSTIPTI